MSATDAKILRAAAVILRERSRKPRGFWLGIFCRILTDTADAIDLESRSAT